MAGNDSQCHVCHKDFSTYPNLYKHMRRMHAIEPNTTKPASIRCPNSECFELYFDYKNLRHHITNVHGLLLERSEYNFDSEKDFQDWKENVEVATKCYYARESSKVCGSKKFIYYTCHRSGIYYNRSRGMRRSRLVGTKRINGHCPSTIKALIYEKEVRIVFYSTHYGHDFNISHLPISCQIKTKIADESQKGKPMESVFNDIQCDIDIQDIPPHGLDLKSVSVSKVKQLNDMMSSKVFSQETYAEVNINFDKCVKIFQDSVNSETIELSFDIVEDEQTHAVLQLQDNVIDFNQDISPPDLDLQSLCTSKIKQLNNMMSSKVFPQETYTKVNGNLNKCVQIFQDSIDSETFELSFDIVEDEQTHAVLQLQDNVINFF